MKLNIKSKDEEIEKKPVVKPVAKPDKKAKPILTGPSQSRPKASLVGEVKKTVRTKKTVKKKK